MLEIIAKTLLLPGQEWFIMILLIIGFWGIKRRIFGALLLALLGSFILNKFLKHFFQVPLPPGVAPNLDAKAYGFPSGHTQSVTLILTWLALEWKQRWFSIGVVVWLAGYLWAIVHMGYHYPVDPPAGLIVGLWWCFTCRWLFDRPWIKDQPYWAGVLLALGVSPLLFFVPWVPTVGYFAGMLGFSLGWSLIEGRCEFSSQSFFGRMFSIFGVIVAVLLCHIYIKGWFHVLLPQRWVFIGWFTFLAFVFSTAGYVFRRAWGKASTIVSA
tara:strand:+ start:99443 stop:100249 length:807 start_codon:yes stop_codon:yes gene_type:complete